MYYCSIIRLIDNVSMGTSNGKHLVVQFAENLKECEHNMGLYFNGRKLPLQGRGCAFESHQIHHTSDGEQNSARWVSIKCAMCGYW